jgi:type I restriction enzyme S subunit
MGEVAEIVGGGTPKSDQLEYFGGDIPWITPADLSGYTEKLISRGSRSITKAGLGNSGARLMPTGAVLFSSRAPIGYVAIAANPVSTNQGFKSFVLRDGLTPEFVYYYLQHGKKFALELASGTTFLEISGKKAAQIPIPIAPLPEQRRIVAEIEKQFTRLEAGIGALRRVRANLKRYRAAVLKAACEGRLVPTEAELAKTGNAKADFETGEALLTRVLTERRRAWQGRGRYKEPDLPGTDLLPSSPLGWAVASIDQLSSHITSGSRDWSQFYDKGTGTFILAQNVRPMRLDLGERQSVDAPEGDTETERTRVRQNDILVTIVGAKTGDVCRVANDLIDHFVCQSVALLRPVLSDYAKFAELYLASRENGQAQWKRYIYGQGRPHLSFEQLRMTTVRIPPLSEQKRIVAEVERRLSVVEELETVVSANLQRARRLRQSILQKAFMGQLIGDEG